MLISYDGTEEIEFSTYRLWLDADDYGDYRTMILTMTHLQCVHYHSVRGCFYIGQGNGYL